MADVHAASPKKKITFKQAHAFVSEHHPVGRKLFRQSKMRFENAALCPASHVKANAAGVSGRRRLPCGPDPRVKRDWATSAHEQAPRPDSSATRN
jgi:hypothetical protein